LQAVCATSTAGISHNIESPGFVLKALLLASVNTTV